MAEPKTWFDNAAARTAAQANLAPGEVAGDRDTGYIYRRTVTGWADLGIGGDGGTISMMADANGNSLWPQETAYTTWLVGDAATFQSVAVATPVTISVDMRKINKYHGTVEVITGAGTGTLAVTVQGSRDELSDLYAMTLAAPISALAASSKAIIKLDDTGLAYFHFLHLTFTASTATVPVKSVLMGRGG